MHALRRQTATDSRARKAGPRQVLADPSPQSRAFLRSRATGQSLVRLLKVTQRSQTNGNPLKLRELLTSNKELDRRLDQLEARIERNIERKLAAHDEAIAAGSALKGPGRARA